MGECGKIEKNVKRKVGMPDDIRIELPATAVKAIGILEDAGYEAWCVGGYVRDALMGIDGGDVDIATSARSEQTMMLFEEAGYRTLDTGIAYGTVTALVDGETFEITTYRADGSYSDARHPDAVSFVGSIEQDLARRDFTINAMAYHPERGLLDPYGGRQDIADRRIRTVGDPHRRFEEDALRILRGLRFVSKLGFGLSESTYRAMLERSVLLVRIAPERMAKELDGLLCGAHVHRALMEGADILGVVIPELMPCCGFDQHSPWHKYTVYEHIAYVVQNSPATAFARWCALMHDIAKPQTFQLDGHGRGHFPRHPAASADIARSVLTRLRKPNRFVDDAATVIRYHDTPLRATSTSVRKFLVKKLDGRSELLYAISDLKIADNLSKQPEAVRGSLQQARDLRSALDAVIQNDEPFRLDQLAINGRDLQKLGMWPGPRLGETLRDLLDEVVDGTVPNERRALLAVARKSMEWSS
jgi:tRNA nucleotidyltransferase (CCA-adding enzyme)